MTQSESFHLLNAQTLQFGLAEADRNRIIRTYVRNNYAYNIDQVTAAILNEYTVRTRDCRIGCFCLVPGYGHVLIECLFNDALGLEESGPGYGRLS